MLYKRLLSLTICLFLTMVIIVLAACGNTVQQNPDIPNSNIKPSTQGNPLQTNSNTTEPEPYKFQLGKMVVTSTNIVFEDGKYWLMQRQPVKVMVEIQNVGSETNYYRANLTVDKVDTDTCSIQLNPRQIGSLVYNFKPVNYGTYKLAVAGIEETLCVLSLETFSVNPTACTFSVPVRMGKGNSCVTPNPTIKNFGSPVNPFFINDIFFKYGIPDKVTLYDINNNIRIKGGLDYIAREGLKAMHEMKEIIIFSSMNRAVFPILVHDYFIVEVEGGQQTMVMERGTNHSDVREPAYYYPEVSYVVGSKVPPFVKPELTE